ncbi:iron-containing alcohol dehydrogenase family protein [Pectobacterium brasiliense]|uniref:iron-containing alcohol dehydrogenase family protein n=1 Tax=Pectobacterium brasiliense TaxID=180957 RepID=UPI001CE0955D|nr:iron-containing alcohol dehydrogenase family protein [Pectobacterium brasiliense]MCA5918415.1 iron-containing alcohol dehydrogenase family protein [Pectobacterium brasiliense]MCA5926046.1 iron-containing alcohol dehydrogenase family protein [Pectobacterium brasiliense]MCA5934279.1 iron-containing alcohol dehydrogenase family protein [Pectobacterium brasiliense]MCA5938461.1 iron-containing alcohol dehydrogenase family protein [Pectobacterium brasiliense]MCA5943951.1 iron-containing alcohol d
MIAIQAPQTYLNRDGVIRSVGDYAAPYASTILIITSPQAWKTTADAVERSLNEHGLRYQVEFLPGDCTKPAIETLTAQARAFNAELILGIGGGRVLDVAKAIGDILGQLPVIAVPTIAATCAAWSPISVIYSESGAHNGPFPLTRLPVWVLVDSEIIAHSPSRYLKAGIVDALAKWYEFQPYLRHGDDGLALALKAQAAKLAVETFNTYGEQAIADNEQGLVTPALRRVIDAVIAIAGVANSMKDEVPRIGVAHAIHNSMTRLPELHDWLHGEKVGFGLAAQAFLEHDSDADREELFTQLRRYGSPITLSALGLNEHPQLVENIAQHVKIAPKIAAHLPFATDAERIQQALWRTQTLETRVIDSHAA